MQVPSAIQMVAVIQQTPSVCSELTIDAALASYSQGFPSYSYIHRSADNKGHVIFIDDNF